MAPKKKTKTKTKTKTKRKVAKPSPKKTNPIGPGTENLCINFTEKWKALLEKQAEKNDMKTSEYCRIILIDSVQKDTMIEKTIKLTISNK